MPDSATSSILTPIYQTPTDVQEAVGVHKGFTYSRSAILRSMLYETFLGRLKMRPAFPMILIWTNR